MARKSPPGAKPPEPGPPALPAAGEPHDPLASQFADATRDDWRRLLLRKESGALVDCWQNVYVHLMHHPQWRGVIWLDEFSNRIMRRFECPIGEAGPWDPTDSSKLGYWLSQQGADRLVVRAADPITQAVVLAAQDQRFHPVREWLKALKWDATPRLITWLADCLDVKQSAYSELVGRYFLVAMVARVMRPGCDFKYMPILCGPQDAGKSRAMKALGAEWFADTPFDMRDKDAMQVLRGKWLYEMSEMDAFNRAESARAKSFIGSPSDNYRASYDSHNRDWPRQVVFLGTSNPVDLFKDPTGNVRYWPLVVGDDLRVDLVAELREQLYAEAYAAWLEGARFVPTREQSAALFAPVQEEHEQRDPWVDFIAEYLVGKSRVYLTDIYTEGLKIERGKVNDLQMARRVGHAMRKLGWDRKRETNGARGYYYVPPADAPTAPQPTIPAVAGVIGARPDEVPF